MAIKKNMCQQDGTNQNTLPKQACCCVVPGTWYLVLVLGTTGSTTGINVEVIESCMHY